MIIIIVILDASKTNATINVTQLRSLSAVKKIYGTTHVDHVVDQIIKFANHDVADNNRIRANLPEGPRHQC